MPERISMSSDQVVQSFYRLHEAGYVVKNASQWWEFVRLPDTPESFLWAVTVLRCPLTNVLVGEGGIWFSAGFTG